MLRIIKSFSEVEQFDKLSFQAEVFFRRLWNEADDFGRFHANPLLLKAKLFPLRESVRTTDISRWLAECEAVGVLACYTVDDVNYLEIKEFNQRTRVKNGKYPQMSDTCQTNDGQMSDRCPLEEEEEDEEEENKKKNIKKKNFVKPTVEEVEAYAKDKSFKTLVPIDFWEYYENKEWKIGNSKMKDWKLAANRWERNNSNTKGHRYGQSGQRPATSDEDHAKGF